MVLARLLPGLLVAASPPAASDGASEIVKRVGRVTIRVDSARAFPGGLVVVRLSSRSRLGAAWAILDGRRAPFKVHRGVPRALVPVPVDATSGAANLGIEIMTRQGGRQRIPVEVELSGRPYPERTVLLGPQQRALLELPDVTRDGRRLLGLVRTESEGDLSVLQPPLASAVGSGFGEARRYPGGGDVEGLVDATPGEHHRGLDYRVAEGTAVVAPAAGTVLFAGALALGGETLVLDHGHGVMSALLHLKRIDVVEGDRVSAGVVLGLSGRSGFVPEPMLEWRVYVHGIAVDPAVALQALSQAPAASYGAKDRAARRASARTGAGQTPSASVTAAATPSASVEPGVARAQASSPAGAVMYIAITTRR
jgi:murein DD-endopeptidase MepM/ murein hydrolase activator NlpD